VKSEVGVIGDIHGDLAKLREIIAAAVAEVRELVFVGDYVNRGPNSAGVIEYLLELGSSDVRCTFVAGNHDQAFLDALIGDGFDAFLQMGGAATIRTYVDEIEPDVEWA
jgi:Calcineurin-like phosphoesterase.